MANGINYPVRKRLWFSQVVWRHTQKEQKNIDRIVDRFCLLHHYYRKHRQTQAKQSEQRFGFSAIGAVAGAGRPPHNLVIPVLSSKFYSNY